jgi:hypothetical protein
MSAYRGWSEPVDATLHLEGEMECGLMVHKFHRGFTAAEKTELWDRWKRGEAKGDRTRFWQAVIVDLFFGGSAWWDSSCRAASRRAGIDARGTRGDFQRRYGTSIGTIDRQVAWPLSIVACIFMNAGCSARTAMLFVTLMLWAIDPSSPVTRAIVSRTDVRRPAT